MNSLSESEKNWEDEYRKIEAESKKSAESSSDNENEKEDLISRVWRSSMPASRKMFFVSFLLHTCQLFHWPGFLAMGLISGGLSIATLNQARALANLFLGRKCWILPLKNRSVSVTRVLRIEGGAEGFEPRARGFSVTVACTTDNQENLTLKLACLCPEDSCPRGLLAEAGISPDDAYNYDAFRSAY
eukprot:TRINITY_DN2976_c0_g3_i1.p1 TRINITY_DN2976_c0_g3~~TRINITY_DN2976_c0_g3_i1.p1  ORF type:complete len:187 (-),score=8.49 TRINITY_DN2976_c0_g3_i1:1777-2337(-)